MGQTFCRREGWQGLAGAMVVTEDTRAVYGTFQRPQRSRARNVYLLCAVACLAVAGGSMSLIFSPASHDLSLQELDRADGKQDGPSAYWMQGLPKRLWPKKKKSSASAVLQYVQKLEAHPPNPFWRVHAHKNNLPELVLKKAKEIRKKSNGAAIWHDKALLKHRANVIKANQLKRMANELLVSAKNEGVLARNRLAQGGHLMLAASKFGARAEQLKVNAQLSRSNPKHASTMMLAAMVQGPQVTKKQVDDAAKA